MLRLVLLAQLATTTLAGSPRNPSFGPDGRIAVSVDGDLWIGSGAAGAWLRVTSGAAWDREPAWSPDGGSLVFASDRGGAFHLWRVRVGPGGAEGEPERLTASAEPDGAPTVASDGRVAFVRGRGATTRLWIRLADGSERRVTSGSESERDPAFTRDGRQLAYVAGGEGGGRLHVRWLATSADSTVGAERGVEHPAWSPDGGRIVFTVGGPRSGVFVTPIDGRYSNLLSERHAEPAWSADGRTIALAAIVGSEQTYNGDPDRLGDVRREIGERLRDEGGLWTLDAPPAVDSSLARREVRLQLSRAGRNEEVLDRAWTRIAALYYASPDAAKRRAAWEGLRGAYRAAALAAPSDSALDDVIHRMLRERPVLREPARGRAAVSSAHPVATEAGLAILRQGGNVVDAAVAVSFALGVVEPDASGVGGYGQMLVRLAGMEKPILIEFMSRVPEEGSLANANLTQDGRYPSDGPVLAIVPGTVAGMYAAWKKYGSGKAKWADLLAPAIKAARDGYVVSDGLATTLATEREHFVKYEGSRALFFKDGKPLVAGDTVRNPDLAWVLGEIAARGADGFYRGAVAARLVQDLRGKGNAMRLNDLARYYAAERDAVAGAYRGYRIYSSAPPASGGASLVGQLNLLEQLASPQPYTEDAATLHAMIAAWQLVPSARNRIADPGLWPVDVTPFTSKDTARARWRCFDPARAIPLTAFRGDTLTCPATTAKPGVTGDGDAVRRNELDERASSRVPATSSRSASLRPGSSCGDDHAAEVDVCHSAGTTAFTVADNAGNAVAVTQTLGTWGGNFYVSPGLGFLYNDKLLSYGTDPAQYGARLPNARHGSSIAPTIVIRGNGSSARTVLAVGAAGNAWITSAVYQTLVGVLDQRLDVQHALELPRFLVAGRGFGPPGAARMTTVELEDGFAPGVIRRLRAMGYVPELISFPGELRMGYGSAIALDDHTVTAGADPRRAGAAGAIP